MKTTHASLDDVKQRLGFVEASGYADSGTSTTLVDTERTEEDDVWIGKWLSIVRGTNEGESRKISDFVASSDTITVSSAFTAAIDDTSEYIITNEENDMALKRALEWSDAYINAVCELFGGTVESTTPQAIIDVAADLAAYHFLRDNDPTKATRYLVDAKEVLNIYTSKRWKLGVVLRHGREHFERT